MVAVRHATGLRIVVGNIMPIDTFIKLVIKVQSVLGTGKHTVVVAPQLFVSESLTPDTALVYNAGIFGRTP